MLGRFLVTTILCMVVIWLCYKINEELNLRDIAFSLFLISYSAMNYNKNIANVIFIIAIALNVVDICKIAEVKIVKD